MSLPASSTTVVRFQSGNVFAHSCCISLLWIFPKQNKWTVVVKLYGHLPHVFTFGVGKEMFFFPFFLSFLLYFFSFSVRSFSHIAVHGFRNIYIRHLFS